MALELDGIEVTNVLYDGVQVQEVRLDGVSVWFNTRADLSGIPVEIYRELNFTGPSAYAGYQIRVDGSHYQTTNPTSEILPEWIIAGVGSDFHVKVTKLSGNQPSISGSPVNLWLSLDTQREWYIATGTGTTNFNAQIRIDISIDGGATVAETAQTNLKVKGV